jgi:hypothetical protein
MIDIAIWVIVVPLGAIAYLVWHGLKITRAQNQSTMAALSSLGDTHMSPLRLDLCHGLIQKSPFAAQDSPQATASSGRNKSRTQERLRATSTKAVSSGVDMNIRRQRARLIECADPDKAQRPSAAVMAPDCDLTPGSDGSDGSGRSRRDLDSLGRARENPHPIRLNQSVEVSSARP